MTNPDEVLLATFPIDDPLRGCPEGECRGFRGFCCGLCFGLPICCTGFQVHQTIP